jgi:hypothetical protein
MKTLLLSAVVLFAAGDFLFAQGEVKKNCWGIQAGIAIPYSYFAKNTFEYRDPGFAMAGGNLEADYFRYAGRFFGLSLNLGYAWMGFDREAYVNAYREILPDQEIHAEAGIYQVGKATGGFIFRTPGRYRTEFVFIPWIGYSGTRHPEIVVTSSGYGAINSIEKSYGFRAITGITLIACYDVTERIKISLGYRRNATGPHFSDRTSLDGFFSLPVRYQNISLGVHMNF